VVNLKTAKALGLTVTRLSSPAPARLLSDAKLITLTLGNSVKAAAGAAAFVTGQTTTQAGADRRSPYRLIPRGGL
jgi:hypothetical protein